MPIIRTREGRWRVVGATGKILGTFELEEQAVECDKAHNPRATKTKTKKKGKKR